jgi:hypothetical protein
MFVISLQFTNCKKEGIPYPVEYKIISGPGWKIQLVDKIGNDFNSALDSLMILHQQFLNGNQYYVEVDTLKIDFDSDKREFMNIVFKDAWNNRSFLSDVIDSYGYIYRIIDGDM